MSYKDSIKSEIIPTFDGKNLLITGVTGACGQVFLEKLLRVFTNIGTIFVLIRPKFNLTPQQRFERLLKSNLFKFHEYEESQLKKVKILEGDVTENELGLSASDAQLLRESVNFVFHIAASISFAASFSSNFKSNAIGTENLMLFAKTIKKIECIIYTSTAYSNCHLKEIPEEIVPLKEEIDVLMTKFKTMKGEELENEAIKYFEGRPNNYTFTKALAEHIVVKLHGNIPTAIVRPAVVASAYEEPYPGFVDTLVGPVGLAVLVGLGIVQIINFDLSKHLEFTSVDVLTNATLAITTETSKTKPTEAKVYNIVSSTLNHLPENYNVWTYSYNLYIKTPSIYTLRPLMNPKRVNNHNPTIYHIKRFFYHTVFAVIIDIFLILFCQKRM
ncbi:hypothetical protein B4U79_10163 [Dinothrombium tinctorium]|uniref:Fatty acyl-CoA reductase n=1 Tax=Dinothrombium tinctorium TaxID=1965070 RepID=A0A3S3PH79_9ACAR|nr:hypothetical protein B4U79_10163 [Dinothrombium tinctorium]